MFSTLDLASAKNEYYNRIGGDSHYAPNKSEVSFELSAMTCKDRGEIIEIMIADYLNENGVESEIHPHLDYDIDLYIQGQHIKVEVKSSMKSKSEGKYQFQCIKPEKFDLLVLAFVDPDHGVVVKTVSKREINQFTENYKRYKKGYTMPFHADHTGPVRTNEIEMMLDKDQVNSVEYHYAK
jgi:hypothetical protein